MALRHKLSWSSVLLTLAASFTAIILCSCSGVVASGNQGSPGNGGSSATRITPTIAWASPSAITNTTPLAPTTPAPSNQPQPSVSITVTPPTQTPPAAYLYVSGSSNSSNNNVDVY